MSLSAICLLELIVLLICAPLNEAQESVFTVGGVDASEGEIPFIISLQYNKKHSCGGSIIDNCWILTAAHCVVGLEQSMLSILAGTSKLNDGGVVVQIEKIIPHEDFERPITNDIAIIKLKNCLNYSHNIKPVNLSSGVIGEGVTGVVAGWSFTDQNGIKRTNDLKKLDVKTITNQECTKKIRVNIPDGDICTFNKRGQGICQGDSGGPLVEKSTTAQIGVVSANIPCARGYPDIYTRVSSYIKWIEDNKK